MVISQMQTFFGLVGFTALVGMVRGWQREITTSATLLATLLFLNTGGGDLLANLFTRGAGSVAQPGATTTYAATSSCVDNLPATLATLTFIGMTFIAYRVGRFVFPKPRLATHRLLGMLLGAINGAVIAYYVSVSILRGRVITLGTPGPIEASVYLPVVIGVAILGLLLVVFVASQVSKNAAHGDMAEVEMR